jgi:hypothetical protein
LLHQGFLYYDYIVALPPSNLSLFLSHYLFSIRISSSTQSNHHQFKFLIFFLSLFLCHSIRSSWLPRIPLLLRTLKCLQNNIQIISKESSSVELFV